MQSELGVRQGHHQSLWPFLFESWEASPSRGVLDYRKLTSGASREIAFQLLLPRGGVPAGGGQGGLARGSSGAALRRAGRRTALGGEGREAGGRACGRRGEGVEASPPGSRTAPRWPFPAQVSSSRASHWLRRAALGGRRSPV